MRLLPVIALAAAAVTVALAAAPADAQSRRSSAADRSERITFIDETGRVRTKITVRPRSYLDGGTEVNPGERKFMDYAAPSTYMQGSPSAAWDPTGTHRAPLPMPGQLPGYSPYSYW
jgi:ABC-type amino acid transport substrate-binding protein